MSFVGVLLVECPPVRRLAALPSYRWLVVGTVCIGAFLGQLDASIAGLVLPTLEEVFHAPLASLEWVAISYLLTLAALVVPFGRLADMVGRKLLYALGFLVFIAGSALCGLAPALGWLVAFRVVQAIGAAMLQANSVAIIAAAARPRELGKAIGIQGAAQAIGLAVGPSVGGFLIGTMGWQWVFFIAVPFGLLGALLGWLILPETRPLARRETAATMTGQRERFDWRGAALFGPAIAAALVALTFGNSWGWTSAPLLASAGLALALIAGFLVVERQARFPLVDLTLFRCRLFTAGIVAGLLSYAVLFGGLFLVPFYLERILRQPPGETGLLLSPVPLALGVVAPIAGTVTDRAGSRLPTVMGMALALVALMMLAFLPAAPAPVLAGALALLGAGLGLFTPPNNSAIMSSAPAHRLGVAGGILNMTRSLGTSCGVAATGAVLATRLAAHAGGRVGRTISLGPAVLLPAFRETMLFLALLAALGALISGVRGATVPGTGSQRSVEGRLAAAEAAGA
jgi:EmrB/QacA subfamily drug resistance transporter